MQVCNSVVVVAYKQVAVEAEVGKQVVVEAAVGKQVEVGAVLDKLVLEQVEVVACMKGRVLGRVDKLVWVVADDNKLGNWRHIELTHCHKMR